MFITFWYFLVCDQILISPQVKQSVIIRNKLDIYELPHQLSNNLRLTILWNSEMSEKSPNFIELLPIVQPSYQNENFFNTSKKRKKEKFNFSRSFLFHMKTRVYLKYFVHDCTWKQGFASNLPQTYLNLICLTIWHSFNIKFDNLICKKLLKFVFAGNYFCNV